MQIDKEKQLQQRNQRLANFDSVVDESEKKIALLRCAHHAPHTSSSMHDGVVGSLSTNCCAHHRLLHPLVNSA